jgi:Replication-relaxation
MSANRDDRMKGMPPVAPPMKRLTRPAEPPAFRVTPREIAVLSHLARYRFLTSKQIAALDGGSPVQLSRRLKALWAHKFVDRPKNQHAYLAAWTDEGNKPLTYALATRGARLLKEHGIDANDKLDWTLKNRRASALHLAHTLETATAMIAFATAAQAAGLRLIDHHQLRDLMPAKTRSLRDPFRIRVPVSLPGKPQPLTIGVVPDRLFSLAMHDVRRNYALEVDRGSEPVDAKSLNRTSWRRKLLGYFHLWKSGLHTAQWGMKSFRVLVVAPSEKRINNMMRVQQEVTGGSAAGLVLYSLPVDIEAHGALGPTWRSASAERVALHDPREP